MVTTEIMLGHLIAATACLVLVSCAGQQAGARPLELHEGVYAVVAHECDASADEDGQCNLVGYLELVRGRFNGVARTELALVEWAAVTAASTDYTYNARPLRGVMDSPQKYLIENIEDGVYKAQEWFVVAAGVPTAYYFEKHLVSGTGVLISRVHFKSVPILRDERLNRLLAYPESASNE